MSPVTRSMKPTIQRAVPGGFSLADIPIEIRLLVYDAINGCRLVEIHYNANINTVWSPTIVPMGLHICKESRTEALRLYERCFHGSDMQSNTWFDFRCDTLYFSNFCLDMHIDDLASLIIRFDPEETQAVTSLAIDYDLLNDLSDQLAAEVQDIEDNHGDPWDAHLILIPEFRHLEKLTIVMGDRLWSHLWDADDNQMTVEMCERARDEELGNWKMPIIGRTIGRIGSWFEGSLDTDFQDVFSFLTINRNYTAAALNGNADDNWEVFDPVIGACYNPPRVLKPITEAEQIHRREAELGLLPY